MQNYAQTVVNVLATQFADSVVSAADEETGKAQLTRAAAWEIAQQDPTVGLCAKASGNQVHGLSVDTIVDRMGNLVDIATSKPESAGYVRILPGWYAYPLNPADAQKWVQPTQSLALLPGPMPRASVDPDPGPGPAPGPEEDAILSALEDIAATQAVHTELLEQLRVQAAANTARIIEKDDYNTEKIQQQLAQIVEDFEASAKKVLAIWLVTRGEAVPPVEGGGGTEPPSDLLRMLLAAWIEQQRPVA